MKQPNDFVTFVVEFEDGTTDLMHIDRFTVAGGNHVALIIAREKQEKGQLLSGQIKSVRPSSKQ